MVLAAPCPAFPAVRVMHTHRCADNVEETLCTGKIISDISPVMVGTGRCEDRTRSVVLTDTDHFFCYNIESFVPADPLIAGNTTVFIMAVSVRIKVYSLHRVQTSVRRIDHLFPPLRIRCNCCSSRRSQFLSLCFDRPHIRIFIVKIDRCYTDDFVILNINK